MQCLLPTVRGGSGSGVHPANRGTPIVHRRSAVTCRLAPDGAGVGEEGHLHGLHKPAQAGFIAVAGALEPPDGPPDNASTVSAALVPIRGFSLTYRVRSWEQNDLGDGCAPHQG